MGCCELNERRMAPVGLALDFENFLPLIQAGIGKSDLIGVYWRLGKLLQLWQTGLDFQKVGFGRLRVAVHDCDYVSVAVYAELRGNHGRSVAREQLSEFQVL